MMDLEQIVNTQRRLDDADSALNDKIASLEQVLAQHISTRIEIAVDGERFDRVAFGRERGEVGFLVRYSAGQWQLLRSSSRDARSRAFAAGHISALLDAVPEQLRMQIQERTHAHAAADHLLAEFRTAVES